MTLFNVFGQPLFGSVAQDLSPETLRRTESYDVVGLSSYAGTALAQDLDGLGFPTFGTPHPTNPLIVVTNISARQLTPNTARVTYTYAPAREASRPNVPTDLSIADVSFEVQPATETVDVPAIIGEPLRTDTQEVDAQGQPTGQTVGVAAPGFSVQQQPLMYDTARILFTVVGTATELALNNAFGSIGVVPGIVGSSRTIHVIGNLALLFRGVNLRWTRTEDGERLFTLDYEWRYERGLENTSANIPDGWFEDPGVGPSTGQWPIFNARGSFEDDGNGDALYGMALPNVQAPVALRGVGHISAGLFTKPPYCDVRVLGTPGDGTFAVPKFISTPQYNAISPTAWQSFPGVA